MTARIMSTLVSGLLLLGFPGQSMAQMESGLWHFEVQLNGKPIGEHHYRLIPQGELLAVESHATMQVKFLFFEAFSYEHRADELWREDCLVSLESETDNNNEQLLVKASQQEDSFRVITVDNEISLEGCVRSFAYWDPLTIMGADALLNSQTGELVDINIEEGAWETITAGGREWQAQRFMLTGEDMNIELWYGPAGEWLRLRSTLENGRMLEYRLRQGPAAPLPATVADDSVQGPVDAGEDS